MTEFHTQWTDRVRVQHVNDEPSMTHQSFADECDVNLIIAKYANTGVIDHVRQGEGQYLDVSEAADFQTLQNNMKAIATAWEMLPDELKAEFDGPQDWIESSADEDRIRDIAKRHFQELDLLDEAGSVETPKKAISGEAPGAPGGDSETASESA